MASSHCRVDSHFAGNSQTHPAGRHGLRQSAGCPACLFRVKATRLKAGGARVDFSSRGRTLDLLLARFTLATACARRSLAVNASPLPQASAGYAGAPRSAVDLVLERLGWPEPYLARRRNRHWVARPGNTAHLGRALIHLELAEACDRDLFAPGCRVGDRGQCRVDDLLHIRLGGPCWVATASISSFPVMAPSSALEARCLPSMPAAVE
jgi:hypothetical protein